MTRDEIIWLAGFFDGEGCVGIYVHGAYKHLALSVQVSQKDSSVLHWLGDNWGSSVYDNVDDSSRNSWTITGKKARLFLADIVPHLRGKRKQAILGMQFQGAKEGGYELGYIADELKCLKVVR